MSSKSHLTFHDPCHETTATKCVKKPNDRQWLKTDHRQKPMPVETHLFLVACPVGHLQILIQEVEAQLVNRRFKEVIFHEAEERRQKSTSVCSAVPPSGRPSLWLLFLGMLALGFEVPVVFLLS